MPAILPGTAIAVVCVAELLVESVSVSTDATVAVFESEPVAVLATVAFTVIVAEAPEASVPTLAVTAFPELVTEPVVELPETKVRPLGKLSVTTTVVASEGPLLVTSMV